MKPPILDASPLPRSKEFQLMQSLLLDAEKYYDGDQKEICDLTLDILTVYIKKFKE